MVYLYPERMVADLLQKHPLQGLLYAQVVDLLGKPKWDDSLCLYPTVRLEYSTNIGPLFVKNPELKMNGNSKLVEYGVKEYESE